MKTAIVYATSHGTTEKVANIIASKLGNTTLINLKKSGHIDLTQYQQVIIGGSIHAGGIQRKVREFCQRNMVQLLQMRVGLFICAMNEPEFDNELKMSFPELLRNHAISKKVVGGEFIIEKMNFIEKFLVKKISGVSQTISKIDENRVVELVSELSLNHSNN
ncbi:MAG TPA: flavodoxin domain-containing protein [Tenuifilaceae bacterium]|nr:flavodoxin domain-containing protein [Tenuifilaceae bacterium]HPI44615.1 flavodoxin domain-containing protein [Tenuifilaceae bacterium]HPN22594.1 flavodoxin domain-containing protein [Tenuifilaceae bacterium]HPV56981.1 flavodoxin domain-containing protein [Tenuifilaceae bacterium]